MDITILIVVFIISLFLGSFYNVVGLRTLTGENMVSERSHCTSCGHDLSFLDMIPFFSYVFLGGKCRYCGDKVSFIYPFGEILTAISYTLIVNRFGFSQETIIQVIFITIMVISSVTDLKEQIVPDKFTIIGVIIVGLGRFVLGLDFIKYALGGLGAFGVLYLIFQLSGGRMGGADVKIYSLIGLSIGFTNAMLSLFYASCITLVVYLFERIRGKDVKGIKIPFIPFITMGILVTYYLDINVVLGLL